jgi:superfamily II DNA or RNA helicase
METLYKPDEFKPGSLVEIRDRPWVVLPSADDILLVKPLGGSEAEITGFFKPLKNPDEQPRSYTLKKPGIDDLGDFSSARLLYDAARLSFRNAAGPFRSLARLSFRPRSYQMVPLIMALKQPIVRLLIADDVGIGKTIEALLIAKELYDRGEVSRFAVVCLPHLCEQWQDELKDKFGIEAVIIRSGTVNALDRQIRSHQNIFRAFPFQVISIDYIKTGTKRQVFLDHCPELVIVDEAHTCARPAGSNNTQQLRYHLLHDLSAKNDQHLIMLTATPHSGKQEEFQSLLGLLRAQFERINLLEANSEERKIISKHFVQRRRADLEVGWIDGTTTFPKRNLNELHYTLADTNPYQQVFLNVLEYARELVKDAGIDKRKQRFSYWEALALLRGVMSSPAAGATMLRKKAQKKKLVIDADIDADTEAEASEVLDIDLAQDDELPVGVMNEATNVTDNESNRLLRYAKQLEAIQATEDDKKVLRTIDQIRTWVNSGLSPIIFCRYIQTAKYVGEIVKDAFTGRSFRDVEIEVITSELADDQRKEKIASMTAHQGRRILIATDCLSEGINLQDGFNALLHYDLPWNPNRLEQREGRIDRFNQKMPEVEVCLLYGRSNPVDGVVLEVLLRKTVAIRNSIGISIPFPENSASVMEALTTAILLKPTLKTTTVEQGTLFDMEEVVDAKTRVQKALDAAEDREKKYRSIFKQNTIKAEEIETDLEEIDQAIGNVAVVERFVVQALRFMGVQVQPLEKGFRVFTTNIPERFRSLLGKDNEIDISFLSPTPAGYKYIGRNHPFTEALSRHLVNEALHGEGNRPARAAVVSTKAVEAKTVLIQFRIRNVIAEQPANKQIVAEELWLWGYTGSVGDGQFLDYKTAQELLLAVKPTGNMETGEQVHWLQEESVWIYEDEYFKQITDPIAISRANHLAQSHGRVRELLKTAVYKPVEPVLPMDVLGVYILLPVVKA